MNKEIIIRTENLEDMCKVREDIHNQLVGNQDYIDSNIVLSEDTIDCSVIVIISKDCNKVPELIIR